MQTTSHQKWIIAQLTPQKAVVLLSANHRLTFLGIQLVAVVMDLLTDLLILQDLFDAASKRGVAVYLLLEENGLPHFLDMSSRLQISAQHMRVSNLQALSNSASEMLVTVLCVIFGESYEA